MSAPRAAAQLLRLPISPGYSFRPLLQNLGFVRIVGALGKYVFSAQRPRGIVMRQVVLPARKRLDCGDLSPLLSQSASQAASNSTETRATAPASWRTAKRWRATQAAFRAWRLGLIQR